MKQQRITLKSQLSYPEHKESIRAANGASIDNSTEVRYEYLSDKYPMKYFI